ncbi:hypothetical protein KKA14_04950, partial [bacterium]|nr:hypothetical protein [bacterium]
MILLALLFLIVPLQTVSSQDMDDDDLIDIQGFNYGRLQMAFEVEKNPRTDKAKLAQLVKTIEKNLLWSGIFDLKKRHEDVDLILKLRFIPGYEIRAWIYSPDNKVLFDKREVLKKTDDQDQVVLKIVEEIIFQLTGEQSILKSAIAYIEKDKDRKYRLILTDTFGKNRVVLLNDNKYNILPRWNPDASSILFTTLESSGSMIRQMDMASGQLTVLFKDIGKLSGGSWGKDGKELVMTLSENGNSDLFRISLRGEILERLTFRSTTEANPRLSPNGKRLLFVSDRS